MHLNKTRKCAENVGGAVDSNEYSFISIQQFLKSIASCFRRPSLTKHQFIQSGEVTTDLNGKPSLSNYFPASNHEH